MMVKGKITDKKMMLGHVEIKLGGKDPYTKDSIKPETNGRCDYK